jgi:hypothetical protein
MVEGVLGAAAVVLAACVEESSPSPGNSKGAWELRDEDALMPLVLPLAGPAVVTDPLTVGPLVVDDPLVAVDPLVVPEGNPDENVEVDGSDDVDKPGGSDPTDMFPLSVVWPVPCAAVWACAVVMPRKMIAVRIMRCIAFSCFESDRRAASLIAMQDNARTIKNKNEV